MGRLAELVDPAREIIAYGLGLGADFVEVFAESTSEERLALDDGLVSHFLDGRENGLSLRVVRGDSVVFGILNRFDPRSARRMTRELCLAVAGLPDGTRRGPVPEEKTGVARPRRVRGRPSPGAPALGPETLASIERGGKAYHPAVFQVNASVRRVSRAWLVVNSRGVQTLSEVERTAVTCTALARSGGRVQAGSHNPGASLAPDGYFARQRPEDIGAEAARIAVAMLDARPAPTGVMPVVIGNGRGGTIIHEACVHPLEADFVLGGRSVYRNRLGQAIASPIVTVIDDAGLPEAIGGYSHDDEGTPARSTTVVEAGRLVSFLTDLQTSRALGLPATGNGRRQSFAYPPFPRMSNTFIAPGHSPAAEILADTPKGVYARQVAGGEVNEVTGEFVFTVSEGYLIEGGRITAPLHRVTLVGAGPDVLLDIDRVGDDPALAAATCGKNGQFLPVSVGQPTIRVRRMVVGGTALPGGPARS